LRKKNSDSDSKKLTLDSLGGRVLLSPESRQYACFFHLPTAEFVIAREDGYLIQVAGVVLSHNPGAAVIFHIISLMLQGAGKYVWLLGCALRTEQAGDQKR
jgi:hypothetical protein